MGMTGHMSTSATRGAKFAILQDLQQTGGKT